MLLAHTMYRDANLHSLSSPGIIYSDIGTSPLYVLNGIWPGTGPVPSEEDVIGSVSAILWSLTLLPLIKYVGLHLPVKVWMANMFFQVIISLRFGTHEGEFRFLV